MEQLFIEKIILLQKELQETKVELQETKEELQETKEKLKKYTAPERSRIFYKHHKEEMLIKNKEYYKEKVTPEKRKEYARTAYLNKKKKYLCTHDKQLEMCRICDGSSLCVSSFCDTMKNPKYDNYCLRCFVHLFPDKPNTRNYKTKEQSVVNFVLQQFPSFSWATDKKITDGCSRRRPDLLLDLGYQVLIVEIDENQHQTYDCSCENKRLMELSIYVGHRPIVFLRFNPDEYMNKTNEKIKSCWKANNQGILQLQKNKIEEWNHRLTSLKEQIEYWCQEGNRTEKTVEVIPLYFDE
jgi:hypothetical protein